MKKIFFTLAIGLVFIVTACGAPAAAPVIPVTGLTTVPSTQTFTVLVGADDTSVGANLDAYFPANVHVHVGDTVTWQRPAGDLQLTIVALDDPDTQ